MELVTEIEVCKNCRKDKGKHQAGTGRCMKSTNKYSSIILETVYEPKIIRLRKPRKQMVL